MHAAAGEVDAKLAETSTAPCQRVITQPKIITDHFAFADSMPQHARARPALVPRSADMHAVAGEVDAKLEETITGLQFCPPPFRANA
jgi:hypothetical protein